MTQTGFQARRRTGLRYTILLFLIFALIGGWIWFWNYASAKTQTIVDGWRAREARSGRTYDCGSQTIGGFPFRFELDCRGVTVVLPDSHPPFEVKAQRILTAAQVYDPTLIISELTGPVTVAEPGQQPAYFANWELAQTSVRGTPRSPERVAIVFDRPVLDRMEGGLRQNLLTAKHIEIHGRVAEGSARANPVIEVALNADDASVPGLHPAAVTPVDADIIAVLRGLKDFSGKPWPQRFREIQEAGGSIEISKARVQQGPTLAVGSGTLKLNAQGRLEGQVTLTIAGLEPFLKNIGADKMIKTSPDVNKIAGALDRLMPGLGSVAREQAGANVALGINLIGQPATLEGKKAVTLPLRLTDGKMFLGPIPVGNAPALF